MKEAVENFDMVIVSGGSSVGVKDATFKVYDKLGEVGYATDNYSKDFLAIFSLEQLQKGITGIL